MYQSTIRILLLISSVAAQLEGNPLILPKLKIEEPTTLIRSTIIFFPPAAAAVASPALSSSSPTSSSTTTTTNIPIFPDLSSLDISPSPSPSPSSTDQTPTPQILQCIIQPPDTVTIITTTKSSPARRPTHRPRPRPPPPLPINLKPHYVESNPDPDPESDAIVTADPSLLSEYIVSVSLDSPSAASGGDNNNNNGAGTLGHDDDNDANETEDGNEDVKGKKIETTTTTTTTTTLPKVPAFLVPTPKRAYNFTRGAGSPPRKTGGPRPYGVELGLPPYSSFPSTALAPSVVPPSLHPSPSPSLYITDTIPLDNDNDVNVNLNGTACECAVDVKPGLYCGYCSQVLSCRRGDGDGCFGAAFVCGGGSGAGSQGGDGEEGDGSCRGLGSLEFCGMGWRGEGEDKGNCPIFW